MNCLQLSLVRPDMATSIHSVWLNFRRIESKVSTEALEELHAALDANDSRRRHNQRLLRKTRKAEKICATVQALTDDLDEVVSAKQPCSVVGGLCAARRHTAMGLLLPVHTCVCLRVHQNVVHMT